MTFTGLEALIQTLDADRDKLIVYQLADTIFVTFRGWKEWKLRNVRGNWQVVKERSLYNAIYPQDLYIPTAPPANVCLCCGGSGDVPVEVKRSRVHNWHDGVVTDVCLHCNGTGTAARPSRHVAMDREIHDMQAIREGAA